MRYGRHESEPPDFGDGALHVLQGMLVDPVVEDMRILGNINMFFAGGERCRAEEAAQRDGAARHGAQRRGGRASEAARPLPQGARQEPLPVVPYIFVAPEKRGAIGAPGLGGLPRPLRRLEGPALARLPVPQPPARRREPTHGELLSYLFFDQEFIEELIRMGRNDARRWLRSDPGPDDPWQIGPLDAFTRSSAGGQRVRA